MNECTRVLTVPGRIGRYEAELDSKDFKHLTRMFDQLNNFDDLPECFEMKLIEMIALNNLNCTKSQFDMYNYISDCFKLGVIRGRLAAKMDAEEQQRKENQK